MKSLSQTDLKALWTLSPRIRSLVDTWWDHREWTDENPPVRDPFFRRLVERALREDGYDSQKLSIILQEEEDTVVLTWKQVCAIALPKEHWCLKPMQMGPRKPYIVSSDAEDETVPEPLQLSLEL